MSPLREPKAMASSASNAKATLPATFLPPVRGRNEDEERADRERDAGFSASGGAHAPRLFKCGPLSALLLQNIEGFVELIVGMRNGLGGFIFLGKKLIDGFVDDDVGSDRVVLNFAA